jgi:hypothetical protein
MEIALGSALGKAVGGAILDIEKNALSSDCKNAARNLLRQLYFMVPMENR